MPQFWRLDAEPSHDRGGHLDNSFFVCLGISMVIILIGLLRNPIFKSGRWRYWCPNVVSLLGIPFCWVGYFVVWAGFQNLHLAMLIYAPGISSDLLDGRMARAHSQEHPHEKPGLSFQEQFLFPGKSRLGAILDPLADKTRVVPIFLHVAVTALSAGMLITGGLFALIAGIETWAGIKRFRERNQEQTEESLQANKVGKAKAALQHAVLVPWVAQSFVDSMMLRSSLIGLLGIVLVLTVASPLSRAMASRAQQ